MQLLARLLLVILALLISVLAYEPFSYAAGALLGLALFFVALYRSGWLAAAALSSVYGTGLIMLVQAWAVPLGTWSWIGALVASGFLYSIFGAVVSYLTKSAAWPLTVASAFALLDSVLAITDLGLLTTMRLVYTQTDTVLFFPVRLFGPSAVAFILALVAALVAYIGISIVERSGNPLKIVAAGCAAALAITFAPVSEGWKSTEEASDAVQVLLVQPAFESQLKMGEVLNKVPEDLAISLKWVRSYASQYALGATQKPDLALLPADVISIQSLNSDDVAFSLTQTSKLLNAPLLFGAYPTGADSQGVGHYVLWGPKGKIKEWDLQPITRMASDFRQDNGGSPSPGVLMLIEIDGTTYGIMETAYSYPALHETVGISEAQVLIGYRPTLPRRADGLVGHAHLTSARLIATSIDRPVITMSELGPSGFISKDGMLNEWADAGRAGFIYGEVSTAPAGPLPGRRDTALILLYILIPTAAVLFSVYRREMAPR